MNKKDIIIIGAGPVGSLLSIYLAKRGHAVKVFERRADMRKENISAGRSINLALSDRGIKALEAIGIMDAIREISIPMHGRFIHQQDGSNAYQPYGNAGQYINSVSRGALNAKLMVLAEQHQVEFYFHEKCNSINWEKNDIEFEKTLSQHTELRHADLIFGSDGAFSATRLGYQLKHDRFQYQQYYINFGYKELHIPPGPNGSFQLEKNALHIWPRGNFMLIALPNIDGSFTCTLFFPFEGTPSFASLDTKEKVQEFFNNTFADIVALMPGLTDDFFNNPTSSLVTVKCYPWVVDDKFALIGDAAHAIVPFFGQGMNCGFEDCSVLEQLMEVHGDNWNTILQEFQQSRKPDSDAIADMALNNFVEMRDKVSDKKFLLQKKIESAFSKKYPDQWIPAYAQVTFSPHIRYSQALQNSLKQEAIMKEVMALPRIEEIWDQPAVEEKMLELLSNQTQ